MAASKITRSVISDQTGATRSVSDKIKIAVNLKTAKPLGLTVPPTPPLQ
jgi:hypothetical protein